MEPEGRLRGRERARADRGEGAEVNEAARLLERGALGPRRTRGCRGGSGHNEEGSVEAGPARGRRGGKGEHGPSRRWPRVAKAPERGVPARAGAGSPRGQKGLSLPVATPAAAPPAGEAPEVAGPAHAPRATGPASARGRAAGFRPQPAVQLRGLASGLPGQAVNKRPETPVQFVGSASAAAGRLWAGAQQHISPQRLPTSAGFEEKLA